MKISFVLPALNEEEAIGLVIDEIPVQELKNKGYDVEIIIVDGGSTDKTVEIAQSKSSIVKVINSERGYGRQYKLGFKEATGDIIITGDSDLTYPFNDTPRLIKLLLNNNLDFISTNRFKHLDMRNMGIVHFIGNQILNITTRVLFSINIKDTQSGMWIFKRNILNKIELYGDDMNFSQELKIEAFLKLKTIEVPITYRSRTGHRKLSTFKHGFKNLYALFKKNRLISKK